MTRQLNLEHLARRLTSRGDTRFESTCLIDKTLAVDLPDPRETPGCPDERDVVYNKLADDYDWSLRPDARPRRLSVAYEPDSASADIGLLYLGSPGNSFAHVIQPSQTVYENQALWLKHRRQGQEMWLRVTYNED